VQHSQTIRELRGGEKSTDQACERTKVRTQQSVEAALPHTEKIELLNTLSKGGGNPYLHTWCCFSYWTEIILRSKLHQHLCADTELMQGFNTFESTGKKRCFISCITIFCQSQGTAASTENSIKNVHLGKDSNSSQEVGYFFFLFFFPTACYLIQGISSQPNISSSFSSS